MQNKRYLASVIGVVLVTGGRAQMVQQRVTGLENRIEAGPNALAPRVESGQCGIAQRAAYVECARSSNVLFGEDHPYSNRDLGRKIDLEDQVVRNCQNAIRRDAARRFQAEVIEFRRTTVDDGPGRRDSVSGTFGLGGGSRRKTGYEFTCSVDFNTGDVQSARIDVPGRQQSDPGTMGSHASSGTEAMQACQNAVAERVHKDGYVRVEFGSIRVDDRPGRDDCIKGTATADRREHRTEFEFSCTIDLKQGALRSVDFRWK